MRKIHIERERERDRQKEKVSYRTGKRQTERQTWNEEEKDADRMRKRETETDSELYMLTDTFRCVRACSLVTPTHRHIPTERHLNASVILSCCSRSILASFFFLSYFRRAG